MALSVSECDAMLAAGKGRTVLAVGLVRRFYDSSQFVKRVLESGVLGRILTFDLREGSIFNHPITSDYIFRRELAGGGVLTTMGVHLVDLLLWWFGDCTDLTYVDDSMGGVEADCLIQMKMASGVTGVFECSFTRDLRNTCVIVGEQGVLEVDTGIWKPFVRLRLNKQEFSLLGGLERATAPDPTFREIYQRQMIDFFDAIRSGRPPLVSGPEGRRSVEVLERCYAGRRPWELPWLSVSSAERGGAA